VQIVGRQSGTVMVAGDIAPGAEVVVEGLQRMREGVAVRRVSDQPAPPDDAVSSEEKPADTDQQPIKVARDRAS
jgi:hypothetical protein